MSDDLQTLLKEKYPGYDCCIITQTWIRGGEAETDHQIFVVSTDRKLSKLTIGNDSWPEALLSLDTQKFIKS